MFTLEHTITIGEGQYAGRIEYRYRPAMRGDPAEVVVLGVEVQHPASGDWIEVVLEGLDINKIEAIIHENHVHEDSTEKDLTEP